VAYRDPNLIALLSEIFNLPKQVNHAQKDFLYNCPKCDGGRNKFNLSIDVENKIFKCWACGWKGKLSKAVFERGSRGQIERFKALKLSTSSIHKKITVETESLSLSAFRSLKHQWKDSINYVAAMRYLRNRNINQEIIDKWDICYAENGKYKNRIIIPSKNLDGKIDYFIARDFYGTSSIKYKNPPLRKSEIIFGERFIDWKKPIFITEGVFDAIVIYNAIPILGTNVKAYKKLVKKLMQNRSTVILGFDSDKIGKQKEISVAKYLIGLGCTVYTLPKELYSEEDLSEIYKKSGKAGIISLIKSAQSFDELDAAIATL